MDLVVLRLSRALSFTVPYYVENGNWSISNNLRESGWENPVRDQAPDHVVSDAEQFRRLGHRHPITVLVRRPVGVNVAHMPHGSNTMCRFRSCLGPSECPSDIATLRCPGQTIGLPRCG